MIFSIENGVSLKTPLFHKSSIFFLDVSIIAFLLKIFDTNGFFHFNSSEFTPSHSD